tara:strand:+ start:1170 stop:1436 length:267 start_codon:yes stop_codon:yes gene_type:complete
MADSKSNGRGGYDEGKDKIVKQLGKFQDGDDARSRIEVNLRSYNGGAEKVAIQRFDTKSERPWKLGRMTMPEALFVAKALAKLKKGRK